MSAWWFLQRLRSLKASFPQPPCWVCSRREAGAVPPSTLTTYVCWAALQRCLSGSSVSAGNLPETHYFFGLSLVPLLLKMIKTVIIYIFSGLYSAGGWPGQALLCFMLSDWIQWQRAVRPLQLQYWLKPVEVTAYLTTFSLQISVRPDIEMLPSLSYWKLISSPSIYVYRLIRFIQIQHFPSIELDFGLVVDLWWSDYKKKIQKSKQAFLPGTVAF